MKVLFYALQAEFLKSRRTLGIWLCLLAPLSLAFLELVVGYQYGHKFYRPGIDHWNLLIEHTTMMWALLLLPLFVTLQMGLLGAMEHQNKTLKQLYVLPTPRWSIYAAKSIMGFTLIAVSEFMLSLFTVAVGLIFRVTRPDLSFDMPVPWDVLFYANLVCYLAAWLMIAIQFWVSMHWSSFVTSIGVGIVGTVAGVLVISSEWSAYYPWTMSGTASINIINLEPVGISVYLGFIAGILFSVFGAWEVIRHDVF